MVSMLLIYIYTISKRAFLVIISKNLLYNHYIIYKGSSNYISLSYNYIYIIKISLIFSIFFSISERRKIIKQIHTIWSRSGYRTIRKQHKPFFKKRKFLKNITISKWSFWNSSRKKFNFKKILKINVINIIY